MERLIGQLTSGASVPTRLAVPLSGTDGKCAPEKRFHLVDRLGLYNSHANTFSFAPLCLIDSDCCCSPSTLSFCVAQASLFLLPFWSTTSTSNDSVSA